MQHDWPIEQCLLHIRVFFGGKTKSPCFNLFIHWLHDKTSNERFYRYRIFQGHTKIALLTKTTRQLSHSPYKKAKQKKKNSYLASAFNNRTLVYLQVLRYCPKDLQADICVHLNRVILESNPAFKDANTGVKRAIARNFWISHVAPGDRIIHHGESLDVLYFIARGSLEVKQGEAVVGLLGE